MIGFSIKIGFFSFAVLATLAIVFTGTIVAFGQDNPPPAQPFAAEQAAERQPQRPNLLRDLGLSPDQVQAIRRMNRAQKPLIEAAAERLRNANRLLDEAIYADNLDENLVNERIREVQSAQAEISRLRFEAELNLRKILTPEQLSKFREIRRRFVPAGQPRQGEVSPAGEFRKNPLRPLRRLREPRRQSP